MRAYQEASGTSPDCVLLDYDLPDMDAPEVLAELRNGSEFPASPVVILTGSDVRSNSVLNAGAQEYIGKSWLTPESLTRAIENAIKSIAEWSSAERKLRESEVRDFALSDVFNDPEPLNSWLECHCYPSSESLAVDLISHDELLLVPGPSGSGGEAIRS